MTKQNKLFAAGLTAGIVAIGAGYVYSQSNSQSSTQSQNQATPNSASAAGNTSTADSKQAVTIAYQTGGLTQPNLLKPTKPMNKPRSVISIGESLIPVQTSLLPSVPAALILAISAQVHWQPLPPKAYRFKFFW